MKLRAEIDSGNAKMDKLKKIIHDNIKKIDGTSSVPTTSPSTSPPRPTPTVESQKQRKPVPHFPTVPAPAAKYPFIFPPPICHSSPPSSVHQASSGSGSGSGSSAPSFFEACDPSLPYLRILIPTMSRNRADYLTLTLELLSRQVLQLNMLNASSLLHPSSTSTSATATTSTAASAGAGARGSSSAATQTQGTQTPSASTLPLPLTAMNSTMGVGNGFGDSNGSSVTGTTVNGATQQQQPVLSWPPSVVIHVISNDPVPERPEDEDAAYVAPKPARSVGAGLSDYNRAKLMYAHYPFIVFEENNDPEGDVDPDRDRDERVEPRAKVRRQTRNFAYMLRRLARKSRYVMLQEDDFNPCPQALARLIAYTAKASNVRPDWLSIRASMGGNGIILRAMDVYRRNPNEPLAPAPTAAPVDAPASVVPPSATNAPASEPPVVPVTPARANGATPGPASSIPPAASTTTAAPAAAPADAADSLASALQAVTLESQEPPASAARKEEASAQTTSTTPPTAALTRRTSAPAPTATPPAAVTAPTHTPAAVAPVEGHPVSVSSAPQLSTSSSLDSMSDSDALADLYGLGDVDLDSDDLEGAASFIEAASTTTATASITQQRSRARHSSTVHSHPLARRRRRRGPPRSLSSYAPSPNMVAIIANKGERGFAEIASMAQLYQQHASAASVTSGAAARSAAGAGAGNGAATGLFSTLSSSPSSSSSSSLSDFLPIPDSADLASEDAGGMFATPKGYYRTNDMLTFATYLEQHQSRLPPDHLFTEWATGGSVESRAYKQGRAHMTTKFQLFEHKGVVSTLREELTGNYPGCYSVLAKVLLPGERYQAKECAHDDLWPCLPANHGLYATFPALGPTTR